MKLEYRFSIHVYLRQMNNANIANKLSPINKKPNTDLLQIHGSLVQPYEIFADIGHKSRGLVLNNDVVIVAFH